MNNKEIHELIKLVSKSNLTEFKIKKADFQISMRTDKYSKSQKAVSVVQMPQTMATSHVPSAPQEESIESPSAPSSSNGSDKDASESTDHLIEIKSPIVGTFYRSSSPDKPPYFKVGDRVEIGSVVCIVEAMKLFNEIEAEVAGKVVKVFAEDASPVEYDQPLFLIDPTK